MTFLASNELRQPHSAGLLTQPVAPFAHRPYSVFADPRRPYTVHTADKRTGVLDGLNTTQVLYNNKTRG